MQVGWELTGSIDNVGIGADDVYDKTRKTTGMRGRVWGSLVFDPAQSSGFRV